MAPAREPSMALLFHPKKNKKQTPAASPRPKASTSPRPTIKPASPSQNDDDTDTFKLPEGPYQEYKLMSSALKGWKFDVMKFDTRKVVDLNSWIQPVKLNRKDLRREDPSASTAGQAVRPMLGLDGQQVFGADGKPVMVDAEGRPVVESNQANGKGKGGSGGANGKKKFQKKTKQVFIVPEEIRALRKEERYPWVMEDSGGQETWVGQLDELSKSETHAFFMPAAAGDTLKFVPSHRWYRFQKKLKHDLPTDTQTVESAYQQSQKRDPAAWLRQRNGKGPSSATAAMFKAEAEGHIPNGGSGSLVQHSSQSLGPGGRRLKTVESGGGGLFGDDDEDGGARRRREREYGGEGDLDENEYEEEFADDDEKIEVDNDDQETKELEERLKREYKSANKTREGYIDESDEEEKPNISKSGKAMKKMLKNREGEAYDSEEEDNPYASSQEEEEEEEIPPPTNEPAVQQQPQQIKPKTEPTEPSLSKAGSPPPQSGTQSSAQPASPTSPSLGGHSVVAKRATSPPPPKAPKLKTNMSRASSPLAGGSGSRAGSPVTGPGSRASSPVANGQKKRKAEDSVPSPTSPSGTSPNVAGQQPKPKKRKNQNGAVATPTGPLEDWMLIDWLKNTPNASTRECIQYFTPYLTDEKEKSRFTGLVKEFATLKNGVLTLRSSYANRGSTPSTTA
ncbi:transcription initiation factor iif subunit alpha [Moniliophthora roreri MCA 2997]|uniref:Transcription initiation factor iif subunit alpha n=1 Tax=Moniliophthora roreri (strain MCA 2997) TaxID=1381753 RepID=V2XT20_MONRO|nr:transcription initiation factor iif subunit alpha [Moniliophthora roreri MCA 2997]